MTRYWQPGDQIVLREIWRGQVKSGRPYTVVEDTPERLILYARSGVHWVKSVRPDGTALVRGEPWILHEEVEPREAVRIITPGSRHSVLVFWTEMFTEFLQWYVNLEDPLVRTSMGFDYLDQMLDIEVTPDLSQWKLKDKDEFEDAISRGILTPEEAQVIRAEGEQVIGAIDAGRSPFDEPWEQWRPDPQWPTPSLPQGWTDLCKYPPYGSRS